MLNHKDDIAVYFHDHVLTRYEESLKYRKSPEIGGGRDLRAAFDAAEAIYHFREQLGDAFRPEYQAVTARCPDYALINDVTNFKKHGKHNRNSQLRPADPIQEMLVTTIYQDDLGEYCNSVKEFKVCLKDGTSRDLSDLMTNSVNFWSRHLAALNVTPKFPEFALPGAIKPFRRAQGRSVANMTITKGLKFGPEQFQIQRYNYGTGRVEPMNLTGYKPIARAFKPRHEIVLGLRNDSTGEDLRETIILDPDQSDEFDALTSDEERQNYVSKLPEVISAYVRLASQPASSTKGKTRKANANVDS